MAPARNGLQTIPQLMRSRYAFLIFSDKLLASGGIDDQFKEHKPYNDLYQKCLAYHKLPI